MKISRQSAVGSQRLLFTIHCSLFTILLLSGCALWQKGLRPSETLPSAADVIKGLESSGERVNSLKGLASVKVVTRGSSTYFKEVMLVKRPGKLRLETIGIFGSPMLVMVTDGEMLTMHVPAENSFSRMELSSGTAPFPFSLLAAEDIAGVFLGNAPLFRHGSSDIGYSGDGDYLLTLSSSDGLRKQVIYLSARTLRPLRSEISDIKRGNRISITYGDYQEVSGILFPKEIRVESSPGSNILHISYEDIELNQDIDEDLFVLEAPEGDNEQ